MPMYEHKCFDCGHGYEEFRAISAPAPEKCPECGSADLRAILDSPAIIGDIQPYQSIVTGETIGSRSKHRDHLKHHGLEEVGDQEPKWMREHRERKREENHG